VRIRDCPAARLEGLVDQEAEVRGHGVPLDDTDSWAYAVRPLTWDTLIEFDEPRLAPTGRRAPQEEVEVAYIISVRPGGTITGFWKP
jgi:hypothetical protein